jgi:hypothetical protein
MKMRTILLAGAAALALTACSTRESEWAGTVRDSAGVTIVANPERGLWTDSTRWQVREVLRIGAEADPNYQFGQIAGIVETSDGRVIVLDQQAAQVKVYAPDGRYERSFGKAGAGPGELAQQGAGPLLIGAGDTLFIPDLLNQRLNIYAPDGTSLGSHRIAIEQGLPIRWETTDAGVIVNQVRPLPGMPEPDSMDVVVTRSSDGSISDTLIRFPSGQTLSVRGGAPQFRIFSPEPIWALGTAGEILLGINSDYRITRYRADGTAAQLITKPFEPRPVTQDDRDMILSSLERLWRQAGMPDQAMAVLRAGVSFGDYIPAFAQFQGGPQGSVWVQRLRKPSDFPQEERETFDLQAGLGAAEWDVFGGDGRYLGVLTMPQGFAPLAFRGSRLYGIWRDELEVQHAMIMEIVIPS